MYDALTTKRVYKPAYPHESARAAILKADGSQFDPAVVEAFLAQESHFVAVGQLLGEGASKGAEEPTPAAPVVCTEADAFRAVSVPCDAQAGAPGSAASGSAAG